MLSHSKGRIPIACIVKKTISSKTFNAGLVARVKASNNEKFSQIQVIADKQIP